MSPQIKCAIKAGWTDRTSPPPRFSSFNQTRHAIKGCGPENGVFQAYVDDESAELVLLQGDNLMVARLLGQTQHGAASRQAQT